jgi:hypothetical protein
VISIPVAVNNPLFRWQAEFWWWSQLRTYAAEAAARSHLIVIDRNFAGDTPLDSSWYAGIPHSEAIGVWAEPPTGHAGLALPLNIQVGLRQVLVTSLFGDDAFLEVMDCDMFHFRPAPAISVGPDEVHVCTLYEAWHLHSLTAHRPVIQPYLRPGGMPYNGGFVPIVGRAGTFRRLLPDWEAIHRDILGKSLAPSLHWWGAMYALQAACHRQGVAMIPRDTCYIPPINEVAPGHYVGHYSVDPRMPKGRLPRVDLGNAPDNAYYRRIREYLG